MSGWMLVVVGFVLLWLCGAGYMTMYRWECFGFGNGALEIVVGNQVDREAYVAWLRSRSTGYEPVQCPVWCWLSPDPIEFPVAVHVVRFPVWPLMLASLVLGGWMVWSVRERRAGQRQVLAGGVIAAAGAVVLGLWVWAGWGYARLNFAPVWVRAHHGVANVNAPRKPEWVGNSLYLVRAAHRSSNFGTTGQWAMWYWEGAIESGGLWLTVPLWVPAAALLTGGAMLGITGGRVARDKSERCACGYSLAGLEGGAVCPECGKGERTK